MSKKTNGVNYSRSVAVKSRRSRAMEQLTLQLKSSVKNTKEGPIPLSEKDEKRINKEIEILRMRL